MKKKGLAVSILFIIALALPGLAAEAHFPAGHPDQETTRMHIGKMDTAIRQLQETGNRIVAEQDPAVRGELLPLHRGMMQDAMKMMDMNDAMDMKGEEEAATMDAGMMTMVEKKMEMMQEVIQGMALQQEMIKASMQRKKEILR